MKTKDILKQAIKDFTGTVIVVSHDREFLDGLVEKVYEFGHGKVTECLGGIYDFLERKRIASLGELEKRMVQQPVKQDMPKPQATENISTEKSLAPKPRLSYAEQRERDKALRRASKRVEESETEVSRLEAAVKDIEQQIAEGSTDPEIYNKHAAANKELENAMSVWELATMDYEELKAKYQ